MEYYILEVDTRYFPPYPLGWYDKFGIKSIEHEELYDLSDHKIFLIEDNMQMVFTDIIMFPCFMVSKVVRDTIWLYDTSIQFQRVVLLSKEKKRSEAYYVPALDKVDCILKKNIEDVQSESDIKSINIIKDRLNGKAIARVEGMKNSYILICMDLANSILRRETVGIGLKPVICI